MIQYGQHRECHAHWLSATQAAIYFYFNIIPEQTDEYVSSWNKFENSATVTTGHCIHNHSPTLLHYCNLACHSATVSPFAVLTLANANTYRKTKWLIHTNVHILNIPYIFSRNEEQVHSYIHKIQQKCRFHNWIMCYLLHEWVKVDKLYFHSTMRSQVTKQCISTNNWYHIMYWQP